MGASPSTANSDESLPDTVILDDNELPPVLPVDPGLDSQNLEDSQRLQDPPLVLQHDCHEEVAKSQFDHQHTDDSQHFQEPPPLQH